MTLRSWRLVKRKHSDDAFSGEGARQYGGRWNSRGVPVVYTAEHASLAVLEVFVHLGATKLLPEYVLIPVEFDEVLVEVVDDGTLPKHWRAYPAPVSLRTIGDQWVVEGRSAVLSVPSAVVSSERLYLLNPQHQDSARIAIGEAQVFAPDPRLQR
ncbi:MAG: RES domain-containing protein [Chloroflexi bacterium]|nr:RES domain-containing protein [Chloroflexota bacterium]